MARPRTGKNFFCKECNNDFYVSVSGQKRNRINYCSKQCYGIAHRGIKNPSWKRGYYVNENGYKRIRINENYIYEHRHIMEKFLGRKLLKSEVIHHIDCNKLNNHIENLQVVSRQQHSKIHDRRGIRNNLAKLKDKDIIEIRKFSLLGKTAMILAKQYGTDVSNIRLILRRLTWKHII